MRKACNSSVPPGPEQAVTSQTQPYGMRKACNSSVSPGPEQAVTSQTQPYGMRKACYSSVSPGPEQAVTSQAQPYDMGKSCRSSVSSAQNSRHRPEQSQTPPDEKEKTPISSVHRPHTTFPMITSQLRKNRRPVRRRSQSLLAWQVRYRI